MAKKKNGNSSRDLEINRGSSADFDILPDVGVSAAVLSNQQTYHPNENVLIKSTVENKSVNQDLPNVVATFTLTSPLSVILRTETYQIGLLPHGNLKQFTTNWNTGTNPAGTYTMSLEVTSGGTLVVSAIGHFVIPSAGGNQLVGSVTVTPALVTTLNPVSIAVQLTNVGNTDLSDITITTTLIRAADQQTITSFTDQTSLTQGSSFNATHELATSGLDLGAYLVVLQAHYGTVTESLGSTGFTIADTQAPAITITSPPDGGQQTGSVTLTANVTENFSGVGSVEYRLDGGAWQPLPFVSGSQTDGVYQTTFVPATGAHTVDGYGSFHVYFEPPAGCQRSIFINSRRHCCFSNIERRRPG